MIDRSLRFNISRGYLHPIHLPSVRAHPRPSQSAVTNAARRGGWIPRLSGSRMAFRAMHQTVTSKSGFRPVCPEGPCSVA